MIRKHPAMFYGWWIVGASFLLVLITGGFAMLGFTAFFEPIANTFGWSYTQISLGVSLRGVEVGLLAPIVGLLVDRWGPRRLTIAGIILIGIGLLLLSRVTSLGGFYGCFALIATGFSFASPTVFMSTMAYWFRKRVGIATGIVASGFSFGGLLVPLVVLLIDVFDWRTALVFMGLISLVFGLPLSLLLRHRPEQYGLLPDGAENRMITFDQVREPIETREADISFKQALRSRTFWYIGLAMMFSFMSVGTVITHMMPYLSSIGFSRSTAGLVAMAVPLITSVGRIGSGWLCEKFNKKRIVTGFFAMMVLGLLCESYASAELMWIIVPFIIFYGIGWGGMSTMRVAMLSEYFGRRRFGSIFGFNMGLVALGNIGGPLFAGWVFDNWGSYQIAWLTLTILVFIGMLIIAATPPLSTSSQPADKG
ncbi:MFS transporter [Chloroflexota bacterium]